MSTILNLDPLVALMSYIHPKRTADSHGNLNPSFSKPKFNIVDDDKINVHAFHILDVLARISVSQEQSQVVAIGLQLNSRTKQIRLTVAENTNVADGLVPHLKNIWGNLQALSNEYVEQRTKRLKKCQSESPDLSPCLGMSLKMKLFADIYQYSLSKQLKQIDKWLVQIGLFVQELLTHHSDRTLEGTEHCLDQFLIEMSFVVPMLRACAENPLTPEEWEDVYYRTLLANQNAKLVLAERGETSCETLALKLHGRFFLHSINLLHHQSKHMVTQNNCLPIH